MAQESTPPPSLPTSVRWKLGIGVIKKIIGTYGFLDNLDLESSPKFVGLIGKGCYFCTLGKYTYE